nr:RNA-directed DNA polymerase, eukaryota [Tanacetum cinerariifolium]
MQKAKIRWAIEGDENSKYFHDIINKKPASLSVKSILVDGDWIDDPDLAKQEFHQASELEFLISKEEIRTAVWGCGVDKSPRPDGFTFEFFQKFWDIVGPDFCTAVEWSFEHGNFAKGMSINIQKSHLLGVGIPESIPELLLDLLDSVVLSNVEDKMSWDFNDEGVFLVKDVRSLLDETFLPKTDVPTWWIKSIPIKVNVFAWKLLLDRLPTRSNLALRNINVSSLLCPICNLVPEDSSHLFFGCSMAKEAFKLVCRWWQVDFHSLNSYDGWLYWFKSIRLGNKSKEVFEGVFYVSWWSIWNFRNQLLFSVQKPRKDAIFDDIIFRSFTWRVAR